jgi:ribosome-associated heat shock protein Hsp15
LPPEPPAASVRLDKWLWQARFFRSRGLAAAAVMAGHVRVNGTRVGKVAHPLRPGDTLTFAQGGRIRLVRVVAAGLRRGPASEAAALYMDLDSAGRQGDESVPAALE